MRGTTGNISQLAARGSSEKAWRKEAGCGIFRSNRMTSWIPLLLFFCLSINVLGQDTGTGTSPRVTDLRTLTESSLIPLHVPAFGTVGNTLCDSSGNLYFNIGTSITDIGPFLSITSDGSGHQLYRLPESAKVGLGVVWTVTPSGTLYALSGNLKKFFLTRFRSDGSVEKSASFDLPYGLAVKDLAATDAGVLFVRGFIKSENPKKNPLREYSALFEANGTKIKDLIAESESATLQQLATAPIGEAKSGDDGKFYILTADSVRVLNRNGVVEAKFKLDGVSHDFMPVHVIASEGLIYIAFLSPSPADQPSAPPVPLLRVLMLDKQTGEPRGYYAFSPSFTNDLVCANKRDGFALFAIDEQGLAAKQVVPIK